MCNFRGVTVKFYTHWCLKNLARQSTSFDDVDLGPIFTVYTRFSHRNFTQSSLKRISLFFSHKIRQKSHLNGHKHSKILIGSSQLSDHLLRRDCLFQTQYSGYKLDAGDKIAPSYWLRLKIPGDPSAKLKDLLEFSKKLNAVVAMNLKMNLLKIAALSLRST